MKATVNFYRDGIKVGSQEMDNFKTTSCIIIGMAKAAKKFTFPFTHAVYCGNVFTKEELELKKSLY